MWVKKTHSYDKPSLCFKTPIYHQTQSYDPISCYGNSLEQTSETAIVLSSCLVVRLKQIGSGPSAMTQKADGTKSMHICMPHHSGNDNATMVQRRSTCRNSFRDIFQHDPFAHHLNHALRLQVLPKNTLNTVWFQSFLQLCPPVLECPTTNNQGSRFLCDVPQTSKISPVFWLTFFFSVWWTHWAP